MLGRAVAAAAILPLLLLAFSASADDDDDDNATAALDECDFFRHGSVCPLNLENVLDIDGHAMGDERDCQKKCFDDDLCTFFTFFRQQQEEKNKTSSSSSTKCVMFRGCSEMLPCMSCFTGPAMPKMEECLKASLTLSNTTTTAPGDTELETTTVRPKSNETPSATTQSSKDIEETTTIRTTTAGTTITTTRTTLKTTVPIQRAPKQLSSEEDDNKDQPATSEEDNDNSTMSVQGVDQGLLDGEEDPVDLPKIELVGDNKKGGARNDTKEEEEQEEEEEEEEEAFPDEYFDDQDNQQRPAAEANGTRRRQPQFYNCVAGGYGPRGPLTSFGHVVTPSAGGFGGRHRFSVPSLPPSVLPQGQEGTYGTVMGSNVYACSPGGALQGLPAPTASVAVAGRCVAYDTRQQQQGWQPVGGAMNAYRGGGAMTRMGRFIVATGGQSFPSPLNSIEVLNLGNPGRWRTLSKLTLPNPTFDHCVVPVNSTALLMTGGFGQESQAVMLDLKGKKWEALQPMKQPRRKHSCTRAKVNGRDGVIVAGGSSDAVPALASLEFFDLDQGQWLSLGKMREGRRFPGIFVLAGNLVVAGGESTDRLGRSVILDSMETLRKKTWRPVKQRLAEPRSRYAVILIPRELF